MMQLEIDRQGKMQQYAVDEEKTLLENFQLLGIVELETPCGGLGSCRKCKVQITTAEGEEEVLACQRIAAGVLSVRLSAENASFIAERGDCYLYPADILLWNSDAVEPEAELGKDAKEALALAVDIGTTTVVCHLLNLATGERLATVSEHNAQKLFGADVIARIQASVDGKLKLMQQAIISQLDDMIMRVCQSHSPKQIQQIAVAGNTVMEHIFCGLTPDSIGVAPFQPLSLFGDLYYAGDLGLQSVTKETEIYMIPAIAGYVGGDITADLLALQMHKSKEMSLLLDIGTNGEMALGNAKRILTCATAAGPAFEGAEISMGMPAAEGAICKVWVTSDGQGLEYSTIGDKDAIGICGSGLIDLLACMLELEIIDDSGCMDEEEFWVDPEKTIKITQSDIRKIQLAKAAIAAGIQVLLEEMDLQEKEVQRLYLAGGFGSYLNPKSAARIGLIPESLLPVTIACGNAAGEGAVSAAISRKARNELTEIQGLAAYLELSTTKSFSEYYMDAMFFEAT